jgi:hypothetical protein
MPTSQPPLDPRKTPWKRGDLCTLDFKNKTGFVLNHTPEYLEVRWGPESVVERLTGNDAESVFRLAHADGLTADGTMTNLEALQHLEALSYVENAICARQKIVKNEAEQKDLDALIERSFQPKCAFDRKHHQLLFQLAIDPRGVSGYWKLRERIHRVFHRH